jgi:hypothetical protein
MITTGSSKSLPWKERHVRFFDGQRYLAGLFNGVGRGVLLKRPTPEQFAAARTAKALEALIRSCTRPL